MKERGQSKIEYALVLALIAAVSGGVLFLKREDIDFNNLSNNPSYYTLHLEDNNDNNSVTCHTKNKPLITEVRVTTSPIVVPSVRAEIKATDIYCYDPVPFLNERGVLGIPTGNPLSSLDVVVDSVTIFHNPQAEAPTG
jgi:hypothetical protein